MDLSFHMAEGVFSIRARAVFWHEGRLLIMKDTEKNWYLTGGRIGWGETAASALERETEEEAGIKAKALRLLWLSENFYERHGVLRHDLTFYYLMDVGADLLARGDEFSTVENGIPHIFRWVTPEELDDTPFFPQFIKERIRHIPAFPELVSARYADIDSRKDLTFRFDGTDRWFNVRCCAIYLHEGRLLAMHDGKAPYYYLPGGRLHFGEPVMEGLRREVSEELETEMSMVRPLWICQSLYDSVHHPGSCTHEICLYFLMEPDEEMLSRGDEFWIDEEQLDHFEWLPVDSLPEKYLMPEFIKPLLRKLPENLEVLTERV